MKAISRDYLENLDIPGLLDYLAVSLITEDYRSLGMDEATFRLGVSQLTAPMRFLVGNIRETYATSFAREYMGLQVSNYYMIRGRIWHVLLDQAIKQNEDLFLRLGYMPYAANSLVLRRFWSLDELNVTLFMKTPFAQTVRRVMLTGKPDLVLEKDNELLLIEFKSTETLKKDFDNKLTAVKKSALIQAKLYAALVHQCWAKQIERIFIVVFFGKAERRVYEFTPEIDDGILTKAVQKYLDYMADVALSSPVRIWETLEKMLQAVHSRPDGQCIFGGMCEKQHAVYKKMLLAWLGGDDNE